MASRQCPTVPIPIAEDALLATLRYRVACVRVLAAALPGSTVQLAASTALTAADTLADALLNAPHISPPKDSVISGEPAQG
jgi:hypothetical protein